MSLRNEEIAFNFFTDGSPLWHRNTNPLQEMNYFPNVTFIWYQYNGPIAIYLIIHFYSFAGMLMVGWEEQSPGMKYILDVPNAIWLRQIPAEDGFAKP